VSGDVVDVPRSLADLTPAWLSAALGAEVVAADVTTIAEGEGFMGRLGRVALTYAPGVDAGDAADLPSSVVAKLPTDDPGAVVLGQMLRVWEREARFYAELAPRLPVRTPRAYYADGDRSSGIYALLLEDLSPYTCGDQIAGASADQAEAAVEWLARFHAAESGGGHSAGMDWVPVTATDPMYQGLGPMLEAVFPVFLDKFGSLLPPSTAGWVEQMVPRWGEAMADQWLPPTLVHADFRVDNLFFDGSSVIALDWQAIALGEGMYDLAYFLGGSLPTPLRRERERDLVERYGQVMRAEGASSVPSGDELFDIYRRAVLMAMTVGALLMGHLDLTINQRAVDLANVAVSRIYTTGADLRVGELL
jgi:hypothetical protein